MTTQEDDITACIPQASSAVRAMNRTASTPPPCLVKRSDIAESSRGQAVRSKTIK